MEPVVECEYCGKKYSNNSNLKNHQKTAKFCLELQKKEIKHEDTYICEHCEKVFIVKYSYINHVSTCKHKSTTLQTQIEEYKKELDKCKLTLEFKEKEIMSLRKEFEEYKKLLSRPTTTNVYNDNRKTNYNIQFNQMLDSIDSFTYENIQQRIKNLDQDEEYENFFNTDIDKNFANSIIKAFKHLTFCTDASRRIVVIKDESGKSKKVDVDAFLNECIQKGSFEIKHFLQQIKYFINDKVDNDEFSAEDFFIFRDKYEKIKEFINDENVDITINGSPLKMIPDLFIKHCSQLYKSPVTNKQFLK